MPFQETFSEYIRRHNLKPRANSFERGKLYNIENYYNAILRLAGEQMAGQHEEQKLLNEFSQELLADLEKKKEDFYQAAISNYMAEELTRDQHDSYSAGFGAILVHYYNVAKAASVEAKRVQIRDYFGGKKRRILHGTVTITIAKDAWDAMVNRGNPEQILNILAQDPIDIRVAGNFMGKRCIKPEPYGWIFSTSTNLRLTDATTSTAAFPPPSLNFNTTRQAH